MFVARVRRQVAIMSYRHVSRRGISTVVQTRVEAYSAAVVIQRHHRMIAQYRKFRRKLAIHHTTRSTCAHVQLYGTRRAILRLSKRLRLQRALYRLLQYYLRMRRLKR